MEKGKYWLSTFLLLVVLTSSVYFVLDDNLRIDIKKTYSDFSVYEDGKWVLAGREYVNLFDGTTKMRASSRNIELETYGTDTIVTRTAQYKNNILVVETYIFNSNTTDITMFPVSHDITVIGADRPDRPYILQYEVQQLLYTGETVNNVQSPQSFGHQMKVEWEDGNYYSRIFKYSGKDEGKLTVKYKIDSDRFEKNVRLFDPPGQNLTIPFGDTQSLGGNLVYDNVFIYGTLNVNGTDYLNITADYIFINGTISGTGAITSGGTGGHATGFNYQNGGTGGGQRPGLGGTGAYTSSGSNYASACGGGGAGGAVSGAKAADVDHVVNCNGGNGGSQIGTGASNTDKSVLFGSAGGGGAGGTSQATDAYGGAGGTGAGYVALRAQYIDISGSITFNGNNGVAGSPASNSYAYSGGGGGGSGGTVLIVAIDVNISNSIINVAGGSGGTCGGGSGCSGALGGSSSGATGSGGRIKIFSIFLENDSTTITKGTGSYYYEVENDFDVLLLSPLQDALISSPVNFTCQSLSGEDLTLNIDGIPNITIEDGLISEEISISDGPHNFSCNTSTFNPYTSYFVVDTTPPTLEQLTPVDNFVSNVSDNIFTINMTDTQVTLGKVDLWTDIDGMWAFRETSTSAIGLTNANVTFNRSINVKSLLWSMYYCDNLSNCAFTENRTLIIDSVGPIVSITYPENISYIINVSDLNYTIFDDYNNRCWYSFDEGVTNSTSVVAGTNFTGVVSQIGSNTAIVYCNDTRGNIGTDSVTYTLDAIRYTANSDQTNTSITGVGNVFINVTVNPIFNRQNISFIGYNLTNSTITQYISNDFTNTTNTTTITSTTNPFYWDVLLYDTNNVSYALPTRYKGTEDINFSMNGTYGNIIVELGADININATSDISFVYIDVDHPSYGVNYSSGFLEASFELIIDFFRKVIFSDLSMSKIFEFIGTQINTAFFPAHQYDEVDGFSFNISGTNQSGYPETIQINNSNSLVIDRLFPGFLIGNMIHLYTLNTGESSTTIFYSNPSSNAIAFFMDDGATFNKLTFDISGFLFGFSYYDEFNNEDVLDSVNNEGMFRGGFALPSGTDLKSFIYDTFLPSGAIDSSLWTPTSNGFYDGGKDGSGNDDGYDVTVANSYNGGLIIDTIMDTDFAFGETGSRTFENEAFANFSLFNIWTTQEIYFTMEYSNFGNRDNSVRSCSISPKAYIGTKTIFTAPWLLCEDDGTSDCYTTSSTIDPLRFHLERNINNSWDVSITGTAETYASDYDDDECGNARWTYNYTNGSIHKVYQYPGSPCKDVDNIGPLTNTFQVSDLEWNTIEHLKFSSVLIGNYDTDPVGEGCENMVSFVNISSLNHSLYNISNSSIISDSIFISGGSLTEATLTVAGCSTGCIGFPTEGDVFLFLSSNGGLDFENVFNGIDYQFLNPGTDMRYKFTINPDNEGYTTSTPFLLEALIETPEDYPTNLSFDFGDDGIADAIFTGSLNLSNSPQTITINSPNLSSVFSVFSSFAHLFQVNLDITSSTVGELYLENFNLTYDPNPVVLNKTYILDFINSSTNFVNFPISIEATNGNITINDIRYDYAGGNDTIEVIAHNADYSQSTTRNITYHYSRWDYEWVPTGVEWIYFAPTSPSKQNVTPYGQTTDTPILNITNYGYGGKDATLSIIQDSNLSCVETTISLDNNKSNGFLLTTNWTEITNLSYLEAADIYLWADYSCNYSTWRNFQPNYYFRQCVDGGICSIDLI